MGDGATKILDGISQPSDLRKLSYVELTKLAEEIRGELVTVVKNNGGHLASNLGVVELSIALHRVFDAPKDKILWDVSHQCYVHKLLTGRRESFATLRQYGGLSGFCDPTESPYDCFGAGHASTSVSAALGIATSRDLSGADFDVVAVIGDGALTGGMALEGLSQIGQSSRRLIVVLNDNGMAISPNVGVVSRWLNKLRVDHRYHRAKDEIQDLMNKLPLGAKVLKKGRRATYSVKSMILPTMILEELGFAYMGVFDGHNIIELETALRQARNYTQGPVFLHIVTKKGHGYSPAEKDAVGFHGVAPNGSGGGGMSYSEVFGRTMAGLMRQNQKIVAITAAMEDGTGLKAVSREFPQRFFDVGICEQHAVTFAAGLAAQGHIPVMAVYSTFLQRAFDQILHDVCIQNLPVIFAIDRGGIVGDDGKTHQGCFDLSYLSCIPNMVLCAPRDEQQLQHLLYTAMKAKQPMAIRYPRGSGPGRGMVDQSQLREIPIGKGELLQPGDDVTLLAVGATVGPALEAAQDLAKSGVRCGVIDARFVKPLDSELIVSEAGKTKRLLTVEENSVLGGLGSAVLQLLQKEGGRDIQARCIALPDQFIEHGTQSLLRSKYGLDGPAISRRVLELFPDLIRSSCTAARGK
jgi:1-deoxy-D-xylulose-5-phosphate synthase